MNDFAISNGIFSLSIDFSDINKVDENIKFLIKILEIKINNSIQKNPKLNIKNIISVND